MKIFLICTIRTATEKDKKELWSYVNQLEKEGHEVHYPPRDTKQDQRGYEICRDNMRAIKNADEVHIVYNSRSSGTHFDMGIAFAFKKTVKVVNSLNFDPNKKSFARMLTDWQKKRRFL